MSDTDEEEYIAQITELDDTIKDLNEKKIKIGIRIQKLTMEREVLRNEYQLSRIKKNPNTSEWTTMHFDWSEEIKNLLQEKFKFKEFRSQQLAAINATLAKKDVLLLMPTGGGKSLVYQLPALVDKHITLVISPLISLIEDQLMALKELGIEAVTVNASLSKKDKQFVYHEMKSDNPKFNVIYVTPEWLAKSKMFMTCLQRCYTKHHLKRIVIDEVHCCSTWGHDFRPDYNHLSFFKSMFPDVPILGLTATATINVLADIRNMLSLQDSLVFTAPYNRPNLYYKIIKKPTDKNSLFDFLRDMLKNNYKDQSGIIYTGTIRDCEKISEALHQRRVSAKHYHAELESGTKKSIHEGWLKNKYQVVVATIAFGMGIDKPDVRFVIHHTVPKSMESLYQESGRAGRDGENADCVLMFNMGDFLTNVSMASSKTEEKNSRAMLRYCLDQDTCRRSLIAEFFGDKWDPSHCNKMCDHCRYPNKVFYYDITPALIDIIQIIEGASHQDVKLTLNKLVTAWYQGGIKTLRILSIKVPECEREVAEHIVGFLVHKGYLQIEKGYTMYTTVAYIKKGNIPEDVEVIMPHVSHIGYQKVPVISKPNEDVEGPVAKKMKC